MGVSKGSLRIEPDDIGKQEEEFGIGTGENENLDDIIMPLDTIIACCCCCSTGGSDIMKEEEIIL